MKIRNTLLFISLLFVQVFLGQTPEVKEIHGQISIDSQSVERITIVNVTTEKSTISLDDGSFTLLVKEGDVLVFSAVNLETLRKKITKDDLVAMILKIVMIPKSIILKEVTVKQSTISAESLGIIPYGQKKYTPAERKLYTATSGGGIDGLLNAISGRKAMLKKEIIVEKKEQLLNQLEVLFEDKYYTETLKIPSDYIKGFQLYCIEDVGFAAALKAKNRWSAMFLITQLAEKYKEIIADEKK